MSTKVLTIDEPGADTGLEVSSLSSPTFSEVEGEGERSDR